MKRLGVKKTSRVIVYDDKTHFSATRVYWLLKTFGHPNVQLLNGGFQKWEKEGRAVEATPIGTAEEYDYQLNFENVVTFEAIKEWEKEKTSA